MDDFTISNLTESRNEYSTLLIQKLTPCIIEGIFSIFNEAKTLCKTNDEEDKYLMTFQNFLVRIPKWNTQMIENESNRIIEKSECPYLEDLLTCVHITYLKILSNIRAGEKQKKIDIDIPELSTFIHRIYIQCARNLYKNVFLFQDVKQGLQRQQYLREIQIIIKNSILQVIRDNMPVENILKAYLDETVEEHEEVIEKTVDSEEPTYNTEDLNKVVDIPMEDDAKESLTNKSVDFNSLDHIQEFHNSNEHIPENNIVSYTKPTNSLDGPSNPNTTFYDDDDDDESDDEDSNVLKIGNNVDDDILNIESLDIKEEAKEEIKKELSKQQSREEHIQKALQQIDEDMELLH